MGKLQVIATAFNFPGILPARHVRIRGTANASKDDARCAASCARCCGGWTRCPRLTDEVKLIHHQNSADLVSLLALSETKVRRFIDKLPARRLLCWSSQKFHSSWNAHIEYDD